MLNCLGKFLLQQALFDFLRIWLYNIKIRVLLVTKMLKTLLRILRQVPNSTKFQTFLRKSFF